MLQHQCNARGNMADACFGKPKPEVCVCLHLSLWARSGPGLSVRLFFCQFLCLCPMFCVCVCMCVCVCVCVCVCRIRTGSVSLYMSIYACVCVCVRVYTSRVRSGSVCIRVNFCIYTSQFMYAYHRFGQQSNVSLYVIYCSILCIILTKSVRNRSVFFYVSFLS